MAKAKHASKNEVSINVDTFVKNFNIQLQEISNAVREGLIDPLKVYASLNGISKGIKDVSPEIEKIAMDEAEKEGKKTFNREGVEFGIRYGYAQLDFETDEVYKNRKESLKDREELLKTAFRSKETFFDNEGVEVPKVPVKSYTKDSLTVKFKK